VPQGRALIDEKLGDVEGHLESLSHIRDELRRIGSDWDRRLAVSGEDGKYNLLENLTSSSKGSKKGSLPLKLIIKNKE
jgi:hypothetical protein